MSFGQFRMLSLDALIAAKVAAGRRQRKKRKAKRIVLNWNRKSEI